MNEKSKNKQNSQVLILLCLGVCLCFFAPIKGVYNYLNQRSLLTRTMNADLLPLSGPINSPVFLARFQVQQAESLPTTLVLAKKNPNHFDLHPLVAMLFFRPIPFNRADKDIFETLPDIGPVLAGRIVKMRASMGGFSKPEDFMLVKGIGKKKFAKIRDLITF